MSQVYAMGQAVSKNSDEEFATFSIRISRKLADQIEARRKISKRSKNKEIELMLENQIEAEVENNRRIMEKIAGMNLNPQSNQS